MVPFGVLASSWLVFRLLGLVGIQALDGWQLSLRAALALMFAVTASAHFTKQRADLVAMVPPRLPARGQLVTATGVLELAGAAGLLYPPSAPLAAAGLAVPLVLVFPANIRAARAHLSIGSRAATPLEWRTLLQVVFVVALVGALV